MSRHKLIIIGVSALLLVVGASNPEVRSIAVQLRSLLIVSVFAFEAGVALWIIRSAFLHTAQESEEWTEKKLRHVPPGVLRSLLRAEINVWLYAIKRAHLCRWEGIFFTYGRHDGNADGQKIFLILLAVELPLAHIVLGFLIPPFWRWVIFALTVYVGLWMYGEWRATRLRPVVLREHALYVHYGVMHTYHIATSDISGCAPYDWRQPKRVDQLRLVGMGAPNVVLELKKPLCTAFGRMVTSIAIGVDHPNNFLDAIRRII